MKRTVGKVLVVAALLAVAGALGAYLAFGDELLSKPSESQQPTPPLTAPVTRGTVQRTVTGVGEVKPLETEKLRPADSWHWLESFDVPLNKRILAGTTLVTYANDETWDAPYDLVVTDYELPERNEGAVTRDDHFIEVQRIDDVLIVLPVPEGDLASLAEGQAVQVKLGADEGRLYDGVIADINEVGKYGATGSTFEVSVQVVNDGSIKLGMSANLAITVAEAADVLTVPVSAVLGAGEDKYVEVYDAETGTRHQVPVTAGITDGTVVEVAGEGLDVGDAVVLNEADPSASGAKGEVEGGLVTVTKS
ncbi:efflux RND transporter periplasmic adaptor subunit [Arabiibacter massiliensis]|uniref:efflux RND transporter periplasmic adaptor subunit n=1 Tax=Arabiibacter massiliensis TaxID=1870985 RepID=UPI0009BB0CC2|nr:HlyD family efflux transporter periplasmic adaptor subunit [Arabiibacter massiliensis]